MENFDDIRWIQRFSNYNRALKKLTEAISYVEQNFKEEGTQELEHLGYVLNDIIKQGLIQSFEFTHELAWKVMKDYLKYTAEIKTLGSKDTTRAALAAELISEGDIWMEMITSRNKTSHTYNEEVANEILNRIIIAYQPAFLAFQQVMEALGSGKQQQFFE